MSSFTFSRLLACDIFTVFRRFYPRLSDRLSSAAYRNPGWYIRFRKAQREFQDAQRETPRSFEVGDLEGYMSFRRRQGGFFVPLEMIAYAKDLRLSESILSNEKLEILRDRACDIAVLAEVRATVVRLSLAAKYLGLIDMRKDIVSCAKGTPIDPLNVLSIVSTGSGSLEDALAMAGNVFAQRVEAFLDVERALLPAITDAENVRSYVQGLRDWVAGLVNWLYETERYFGEKGSEVRAFGWIFVPVS